MIPEQKLDDQNIVIVKHTLTVSGGVEQELLKYVRGKAKNVVYISHPFPEAGAFVPLNSHISVYNAQGDLVKEIKAPLITGHPVVFYSKDVIFTLYYLFKLKIRFDIFVGVDNLNAFSGLICRTLGLTKQVVFYVIDYVPQRFKNPFLNKLYHWIDRFCCYRCDAIWNISERIIQAREKRGVLNHRIKKQLIVPHGCPFSEIRRLPIEAVKSPHTLVYMGQLRKEQGVELIVEALPAIKKHVPNVKVIFIGLGELEKILKQRANDLMVADAVNFMGYLKDDDMYTIMCRCALGLAPYPYYKDGVKLFCDPGKIKIYMACGLPVITTDVTVAAEAIKNELTGEIIDYSIDSLTKAVLKILNPEQYSHYRSRAIRFAARYDWNIIFRSALEGKSWDIV